MVVCLRDGKEAVEQLKAMYHDPEEANNVRVALPVDINLKTKLLVGELALKHQASAQHDQRHPKPKPDVAVHVFFGPFFLRVG